MFRKFIERIINSTGREDALENVYYSPDGVDMAFQRGEITWRDHEALLALIEKLAE